MGIVGHSAASRKYASKQEFINEVLAPFGARFSTEEPFRPVNGELESIGISASANLGSDAARLISSCRPAGAVVFSVEEQKRLLIRAAGDNRETVTVDRPGVTTLGGRRNVPIEAPYPPACAILMGAGKSELAVTVDLH